MERMEKWDKLSFEELQKLYEQLEEENRKLREKIERWEKCFKKWWFYPQDVECLMEEDTLQELRDLGEI